jgi:hypothetical protein
MPRSMNSVTLNDGNAAVRDSRPQAAGSKSSPSESSGTDDASDMTVAVQALPDAAKAGVAASALQALPDAATAGVVTTALQTLPDETKAGVAATALQALPDAATAGLVTTAIQTLPDETKAGVAATALQALPDAAKADATRAAVRALPNQAQNELIDRLLPDQAMTNDIWRWIVRTFAVVLGGAMLALVAAVFVSFWREVNTTLVQMLLTIFTTTAGILAGFVSGRASTGTRRP